MLEDEEVSAWPDIFDRPRALIVLVVLPDKLLSCSWKPLERIMIYIYIIQYTLNDVPC
jgi:hypothetical protein